MPARLLAFMLLTAWLPPLAAAESFTLTAAEWSRPRSGDTIVAMAPVANAVRAWQAAGENAGLALSHPGGEEGSLWAAELRDWLIALGVPPAAIELRPGGVPADRLELAVIGR